MCTADISVVDLFTSGFNKMFIFLPYVCNKSQVDTEMKEYLSHHNIIKVIFLSRPPASSVFFWQHTNHAAH